MTPIEVMAQTLEPNLLKDEPAYAKEARYAEQLGKHKAKTIIRALEETGFAIVPIKPTREMIQNAPTNEYPTVVWKAMLEAVK